MIAPERYHPLGLIKETFQMKVPVDLTKVPKVRVKVPTLLQEFKAFALKGNIVDLAIAFVVGAGFQDLIKSLVSNIIMPSVSYVVRTDPKAHWHEWALGSKHDILMGKFLGDVMNFLIIAFAMFLILVKFLSLLRKTVIAEEVAAPTTKECPMCTSTIPLAAKKCPQCTADLAARATA
jgi:large conductance mechanosensitive channel